MTRVVLFVFAGRRPNMELQLPFIRRILAEHAEVSYDVWNLCRTPEDAEYVRGIEGERITVHDEYYGGGWNDVWRHYTDRAYRDCLFVKLDDDVVFLETARFGLFVEAIAQHRRAIVSANVVNNGACTALEPGLYAEYERLGVPLLDVHASNAYSHLAHTYFFAHQDEMLGQPVELVRSTDWLSINAVGFDYQQVCRIAAKLDLPHPAHIAGRDFDRGHRLGDEGCVNTFPRILVRGFLAGHLTFGPQHPTGKQLMYWRRGYAEAGRRYLAATHPDAGLLPELAAVPRECVGWRGRYAAELA